MPVWIGEDRRLAGAAHGLERTGRGRDRLGDAAQLDGEFGDDAERAFGADEQMRQVVAGEDFFARVPVVMISPSPRTDLQRQHIVAHGAVAHRVGAGRPRRGHAAERSVGAGIDREEQPWSRRCSFSALRVTPGWITQSRSSA
jgi:hypothetical protein